MKLYLKSIFISKLVTYGRILMLPRPISDKLRLSCSRLSSNTNFMSHWRYLNQLIHYQS